MLPEKIPKAISHFPHVEGWFHEGAARLIALVDEIQKRNQVTGHIYEVGVHHGLSAIFLAHLLEPGERFTVADNFQLETDPTKPGYGAGDKSIFSQNMRLYASAMYEILVGDSQQFQPHQIGYGHRLYHLDGGHQAQESSHDLFLADRVLLGSGVTIVDDFFNASWPGVIEGYFEYEHREHFREGRLVPFLMAYNKCFLCRAHQHQHYLDSLSREVLRLYFDDKPMLLEPRTFKAHTVWVIPTKESLTPPMKH